MRVSKHQIIFGANHFISKIPYDCPCWVIWNKLFSENVSFASSELAWTSFSTASIQITLSSHQINRIHPTQKPVALSKWCLSRYANQGDKILDTHFGSGSIDVACNELGCELSASEINEVYFNVACKGIKGALKQ